MTDSLQKQYQELRRKFAKYEDVLDEEVAKALLSGANMVRNEAVKLVAAGGKTGRVYQRGAITHQASAPGEAPASDTGRLVQSIAVGKLDADKLSVEIKAGGANVKYATSLEFGTRDILPRPFMHPAVKNSERKILDRIVKAGKMAGKKIEQR